MNTISNFHFESSEELFQKVEVNHGIDTVQLVKIFGFHVSLCKNFSPSNIQGIIFADKDRIQKQILISDHHSFSTKRFINAYLFSFYQLYQKKEEDFVHILYDESIYDEGAYCYALELLLPEHSFWDDYQKTPDSVILAEQYLVSSKLVEEKIKRKKF